MALTSADSLYSALCGSVAPGATLALGDGVGTLTDLDDGGSVARAISAAARQIGDVRLLLGWLPTPLAGLDPSAFTDVVALMPGWGVRGLLQDTRARFVPTALSGIEALLRGPLRPDALITRVVDRGGQLRFGTEVSWQRALVDAGVPVVAILDRGCPSACPDSLPAGSVRVVGTAGTGPVEVESKEPGDVHNALADNVLRLVPAGARLQYGPGQLGTALLRRSTVPVRIDTGMLTDAVIDLDRRGLLLGEPTATYLFGTDVLYRWAEGRPILRGFEYTHDATRLSRGDPFIAVNTAIEIDVFGQVNCEGVGDKVVGGIGGHPDFCTAGRRSPEGLSVIAVSSRVQGRSPLVSALSRPVSTAAHDIDVIVTERGIADLRDADWPLRRDLIATLFDY